MKNVKAGSLTGKKVLLGVTGGIGAYKAAHLVRDLRREGAEVSVVMTESATRFISPLTMETLSGHPVGLDMFSLTEERTIGHIDRAGWADVFVVAPATANYLGKAAAGIADDLLTTITLAVTCPVVIAPAMNSRMWAHPAVTQNLQALVSGTFGHFVAARSCSNNYQIIHHQTLSVRFEIPCSIFVIHTPASVSSNTKSASF